MKISNRLSFQEINSAIFSRDVMDNSSKDFIRIRNALCVEQKEIMLYPINLNKMDLDAMARYVNGSFIHYSGNCTLLSACLHYNLCYRQNILSAKNISSPLVGLDNMIVDQVVFGKKLNTSYCLHSLDEVKEEILRRYEINQESSFIISAENYILPIFGESGHDFNAIVLCDDSQKPYVQFIDSWKTSDRLPTFEKLKTYFPSVSQFYVRS